MKTILQFLVGLTLALLVIIAYKYFLESYKIIIGVILMFIYWALLDLYAYLKNNH